MDKLEKLIYSVKYLPQILYFGSAGLLILVIFLDVYLIEIIIPLFLFFLYMTYLASKNYKSGGIDPIEKLIYSNKYIPPLLYFGSLAWLIYTFYYEIYLGKEIEIFASASLNSLLSNVFIFWFIYITWLGVKNLKTNEKDKKNNKE
tara:strand:+ start:440 stop:877 length:438 start_codon:yes stop_codon:yes gene_type:complete